MILDCQFRLGKKGNAKIGIMSDNGIRQITKAPLAGKKSARSNFLVSVLIALIGAMGIAGYILVQIVPTVVSTIALLLLIGFIANVLFALICYKFGKCASFETPRDLFRRKFKTGIFVGVTLIILLLIQRQFDVL